MIIRTKLPHRIIMKSGAIRIYQPGYTVTEEDKELIAHLQYHRLYRREMYYGKLQETMQPVADAKAKKKKKKVEIEEQEPTPEGE